MEPRRMEVDAPALHALAHPLRVRMIRHLQLHRRASVTSLAHEFGESTGTTSYHLRQLARHGIVEQVEADEPSSPASGRGRRQQWWQMAVDDIHVSGVEFLRNDDDRAALGVLLREMEEGRSSRYAHWIATVAEWPENWQRASSDMDRTLELNATQLRALADDLAALYERYRAMRPGRGARTVDFQFAVFPSHTGDRP